MIDLNHSPNLAVRRGAGCFKNLFLSVLIAGLGFTTAGRVTAQTLSILHSFAAISSNSAGVDTNSDGANPSGLVVLGNTLYGTAADGISGNGTVFAVNIDGTGFTNLHNFTAASTNSLGVLTNSDGANPSSLLVLGDMLFGTTGGGGSGSGTVFALKTDGTGFTNLHSFTSTSTNSFGVFTNIDGANPSALVVLDDMLYGTAGGGSSGNGMVFALKGDGTGFTNLFNFASISTNSSGVLTNSDGANPYGLIASGSILYGMALGGNYGEVFAVNNDGRDFRILHSFSGESPYSLVVSGNSLYGVSVFFIGEIIGSKVFKLNTDGTGFTNLMSFGFRGIDVSQDAVIGRLIEVGDILYAPITTVTDDNQQQRTSSRLFAFKTDGTKIEGGYDFTTLGFIPNGLIPYRNILFGTAATGSLGNGTVFGLAFTPKVALTRSGPNLVFSWPTNYAGFDYTGYTLQSTTNLGSAAVWTTNSPTPVVVNGQNTVTNPISATQQFLRLKQ